MKSDKEHFRGCIFGGAIGSALGWPIEFLKINESHSPASGQVGCRKLKFVGGISLIIEEGEIF